MISIHQKLFLLEEILFISILSPQHNEQLFLWNPYSPRSSLNQESLLKTTLSHPAGTTTPGTSSFSNWKALRKGETRIFVCFFVVILLFFCFLELKLSRCGSLSWQNSVKSFSSVLKSLYLFITFFFQTRLTLGCRVNTPFTHFSGTLIKVFKLSPHLLSIS